MGGGVPLPTSFEVEALNVKTLQWTITQAKDRAGHGTKRCKSKKTKSIWIAGASNQGGGQGQ